MNVIPNLSLTVSIKNPEGVTFEGEVDALSSLNEKGPFDVLPLHTNFISIVKQNIVLYQNKQKIREIAIDTGVLRVEKNRVHVFLGIETLQEQKK